MKQVKRAGELGLEYFVIDAGWFGPKGDWGSTRGDWKERPDGWLGGRLADISKAVRASGMKFGLWIEAETAAGNSEVMQKHPEYFCVQHGAKFLDFTRADARGHLHAAIDDLVKKYGIEFIKFDFNADAKIDDLGRDHIDDFGKDFADYNAGYRQFLREVRARHPGIYLGGCASGGLMMDLGWARDFDSFWLSDNQSPIYGLRIAKETMLRLPPRKIERWITARSATGLQPPARTSACSSPRTPGGARCARWRRTSSRRSPRAGRSGSHATSRRFRRSTWTTSASWSPSGRRTRRSGGRPWDASSATRPKSSCSSTATST